MPGMYQKEGTKGTIMPKSIGRAISIPAFFCALALGVFATNANADEITGCLTKNGRILNLAPGDTSLRPCKKWQQQVTLDIGDTEPAIGQSIPFYVTLDGDGAEETIATNGPLEIFARCLVDGAGTATIQVYFASAVDGWYFIDGEPAWPASPQSAGEFLYRELGGSFNRYSVAKVVAPDGSYLALESSTFGLTTNILGHDCLLVGKTTAMKGNL